MPTLEVGPDEFLAAAVVEAALNGAVAAVSNLRGARHAVFAVTLTDGRRVVVRLGVPDDREVLAGAAFWSDQLQAIGVPLPRLLARDLTSEFPYLIQGWMEGVTLSACYDQLGTRTLGLLAGEMAQIQAAVARLPSVGRFGEADAPERAPYLRWSDVLSDHLITARDGIRRQGVMDEACVDDVERRLFPLGTRLDQIPSLAFLARCRAEDLMLTGEGHFVGLRQIETLCWGDPRWAPARCAISLLNLGHAPTFAEAWLALSGGHAQGLYWLYSAVSCVCLMADYGPMGQLAATKADRHRLEAILTHTLRNLDRDMA